MSNIVSGVTLLSICSQQWSLCEASPCGSGKAQPWEAPAETLAQPPPGTCSSTANPMLLPDREPNSAKHPLMDDPGGLISPSACEPANAASFSSYCARSLHQPVWSCFLLLPPKNHWHLAQPVSPYWTNNGADPADTQPHGTSKNGQKWPFVCMQNIPPLPPASASGCLSPSVGLYALLWNTTDQHGEEQLKVHSAELAGPSWVCSRSMSREIGLPLVASALREEKMPLIWTSIFFSSCHNLPTSCSCHFPLAIRQPDSA